MSIVVYVLIGLCLGLYAAARDLDDHADRLDTVSAGAVGFFVACFWPIVVAVVTLGIVAHQLRRLIGRY